MSDRLRLEQPSLWVRRQVIPFAIFMGFLLLLQAAGAFFAVDLPSQPWWRRAPEQWIYPLQTIACLVVLVRWWKSYEFNWSLKWSAIGAVFGAVGIGFWILPTFLYGYLDVPHSDGWWRWLGVVERKDGFDPGEMFGEGTGAYWAALVMRFVRAAVVVALVEEIFWRSFMMRLVLDWDGDYWKQRFGRGSWLSYAVVTGLFVVAHAPSDYPGALVYGSLTYLLCIWSRNLGACVVMHAVANLLMGLYAVQSGNLGLW
ncbi:CAAX prenyl protease-related protein [Haloferula rosea]|uniref:CAAX prenyl protease-related protein n=1 Tax=Haloferula rosea TaxID=490093 RepID=A0A934VGG9_9BACT|nr:CAAX prenyl protease-related protein [Haloferula rosea]MBK1827585.1 CAAX prenyl protease-related protein [Haloferula rosea]